MTTSQKLYISCVKRPVGFLGALVGLVVTCPITIPVAVWLHFANKGAGVFFTQERPGKDGRIFRVIKFKAMTDERDADGQLLPDEERITKGGRFVRKTSIVELPQLINVLKGDMALIGPRPLLVEYLPWYTEEENRRHSVRPGISGMAQSHGRNDNTWEQVFKYDLYYVDNVSLWLDIKIFFKTIANMLGGSKDIVVVPTGGTTGRLDLARAELAKQKTDE